MPSGIRRTEGESHNRLTRMSEAMVNALEAHPEHRDGDKAIVFLMDSERGGIVFHGYDRDDDALGDLFMHLAAIFEANGRSLKVVPMPGQG